MTHSPTPLPPVPAALTADAVAALPNRLKNRLDAMIEQAKAWPVEENGATVVVRPDDQTTVTLTVPVTVSADAVCGCLLAPRCLHLAAVLSLAPIHDPTVQPTPSVHPGPRTPAAAVTDVEAEAAAVSDVQAEAAAGLWATASTLLSAGIAGGGAVTQADLLRAAHQARAVGLHVASTAAVRVVEMLRAIRREDSGAGLADLTAGLRDLLTACHRLAERDATAIGVARRDYEPVGDLRLFGLFSEPIRAVTGHTGVATYLADPTGRVWVVSDVKPAGLATATRSTRASADLGEVRLSHHDLARGGLRAVNAHASAAGRLSHGRARQAVAAPGASWFDPPIDDLWRTDPAAQVDRWLEAAAQPAHQRAAASDLAFLDGTVLGADRRGLLLSIGDTELTVAATAPHADPALPYVTNLRALAKHAPGHRIRLIARFTGPRRVEALALAAEWLSPRHGGHVDLGADPLTRTDLPEARQGPGIPSGDPQAPPLHLLRHSVERVVAAGRSALLSGAGDDARVLSAAQLTTAAALTTALSGAAARRSRDVFGRLDPHDPDHLTRAWLAAATYDQAAAREVTRAAWRD